MSKSKGRLKAVYAADGRHAQDVKGGTTLYPRCTRFPAHLRPHSIAVLEKQLNEHFRAERDAGAQHVPTGCRCATCSDRRAKAGSVRPAGR